MTEKYLEGLAENETANKLYKADMVVAKPKPDINGTDLLAFMQMNDGVKFCRIQCKGRSVENGNSEILIPVRYVSNGFLVSLYINSGGDKGDLYCFFESDIRLWSKTKDNTNYRLGISKKSFEVDFEFYKFDNSKIRLIQELIKKAEMSKEFPKLMYCSISVTEGSEVISMSAAVGSQTKEP